MPTSKLILPLRRFSFFLSFVLPSSHLSIEQFRALMINRITIFSRNERKLAIISSGGSVNQRVGRRPVKGISDFSPRRKEWLLSWNNMFFSSSSIDLIKQVKETQSSSIRLRHESLSSAHIRLIGSNRFQLRVISDRARRRSKSQRSTDLSCSFSGSFRHTLTKGELGAVGGRGHDHGMCDSEGY